jgi:hypothetical protein
VSLGPLSRTRRQLRVRRHLDRPRADDLLSRLSGPLFHVLPALNPSWRAPLKAAGLIVAGIDATDDDVRIMRIADHPFFVPTLFIPQTSSSPECPHPLVTAFLRATLS